MKKIFITLSLFGIIFSACNPNKEIYEKLDEEKKPYKTDLEYTLTEADYETISETSLENAETEDEIQKAEKIAEILAFTEQIPATEYVLPFLEEMFIAPDTGSSCILNYRLAANEYESIVSYELMPDDYTNIGGEVAANGAFSVDNPPSDFLPDFLFDADTVVNKPDYILYLTSEYINENEEKQDTSITYEFAGGSWTVAETYILTADNYASMGEPGEHNNFSDDVLPDNYLPTFLKINFPYAQKEDVQYLIYEYYSETTDTKMSAYRFDGENWAEFYNQSRRFGHDGKSWTFDPTIKLTMTAEDYMFIVNKVKNDSELSDYVSSYGDSEYYYGASAYYGNFDMRLTSRRSNDVLGLLDGMTDEEVKTEMQLRLQEALVYLAEQKYPTQEPVVNDIEVFALITYETYEPGDYYYTAKLKCTDTGEFEYIETWPVE